jgi:hypothetical protein
MCLEEKFTAEDLADTPNGEEKPPESILELTKTLAGGVVVFLAPFYTAGWSYIHQYYRTFGVNSYDLSLPAYDPLIYSLSIMTASWLRAICSLIAMVGVVLALSNRRVNDRLPRPLRIVLLLLAVVISACLLASWGGDLGQQRARVQMEELDPTFPMVKVYTESNDAKSHAEGEPELDRLEYKLLIHASGQYFVFRPLKEGQATALQLFIIPEHRVRILAVQRGIEKAAHNEKPN